MTCGEPVTGTRRTVVIVIGCDTDPDRESLLGPLPADRLAWRGVTEGIPALKESVRGLRDDAGREPVFTWLLRADAQVKELCGDYAWVVDAHGPLLQQLERGGDELGWHPHFWRRDIVTGGWAQETDDVTWQVQMLREAHAALASVLPRGVRSVRMGWNYHNDATFAALDQLGIAVDFSALPGMRTIHGALPAHRENLFDWHSTPRAPFRPARADHRIAPGAGQPAFKTLEVPSFVSVSRTWALAAGLQLGRKTGRLAPVLDAIRRPTYWINLTARPRLFSPLADTLRRAAAAAGDTPTVFSTYFHPDELLPNRSPLYDLDNVRTNLESLLRACNDAGAAVQFLQARELADRWPVTPR